MSEKKSSYLKYLIVLLVVIAAYFINVEVQTHLGEKVLAATGLEALPLEAAFTKAKTENKLVLADLSAIWCPTCRNMDKNIFSDEAVKKIIDEKYVFSRVEFESEAGEAFQKRYNTKSFPTILALNTDGSIIKQLPVTVDPSVFISNL